MVNRSKRIYNGKNTATANVSISDNEISVDVNVSEDANNALSKKTDGLYVDISGKADKVTSGKTGEIITADATGNIIASSKKSGRVTLAETTDANTLASKSEFDLTLTVSTGLDVTLRIYNDTSGGIITVDWGDGTSDESPGNSPTGVNLSEKAFF